MNQAVLPALGIVGGLGAFGTLLLGLIGVVRRPDPARYKQIWIKMILQLAFMSAFIGAAALSRYAMAVLVVFLAYRCWVELLRALETRYGPIATPGVLVAAGTAVPLIGLSPYPDAILLGAFAATWLALAVPMLVTRRPPPLHGLLGAAFAMTFISVPLGLLLLLSHVAYASYAFFILLLMAHDGLAEGFGRLLGKRPLWPDISPGKTLGGTVGGVAACLVLGWLLDRALGIGWTTGQVLGISAGVVVMAAVGDLIASSIKREAGIKDFGKILPAHGGILDRVDSMLFTVPAFFAAASWLGGTFR
ncbi:MAG: phosphatidate cytidylyltransferase [Candidatus Sericytochromatia bacterium]|nr:phosphatidate cytidylyltransferase [Candidatus Tanganyikabacteria bacterium]